MSSVDLCVCVSAHACLCYFPFSQLSLEKKKRFLVGLRVRTEIVAEARRV